MWLILLGVILFGGIFMTFFTLALEIKFDDIDIDTMLLLLDGPERFGGAFGS